MSEQIELESYPVWGRQPSEPESKFLLFQAYFLGLPRPNLTECYRRYQQEKGGDGQVKSVPTAWRQDCDRYRWRERWESHRRAKNQSDREWREEQIRRHHEQDLEAAAELRRRALEILAALDPSAASAKDAAALLRLAGEMTVSALGVTDLDRAIRVVVGAGFEVVEPLERPLD